MENFCQKSENSMAAGELIEAFRVFQSLCHDFPMTKKDISEYFLQKNLEFFQPSLDPYRGFPTWNKE